MNDLHSTCANIQKVLHLHGQAAHRRFHFFGFRFFGLVSDHSRVNEETWMAILDGAGRFHMAASSIRGLISERHPADQIFNEGRGK